MDDWSVAELLARLRRAVRQDKARVAIDVDVFKPDDERAVLMKGVE